MRTWHLSLVAALAFAACAGVTTNAQLAPGANLAQYRTYGWAPRGDQPETLADQAVRSSLEQSLAQRGIVPATQGAPDFLVDYHAKTQQRVEVSPGMGPWGFYGYGGWGGWNYPAVSSYTEGTLIVDFIDPRTRQIFWRGTASAAVNNPANPDMNKIANAVTQLMQKYPTQVAATPREQM
jgi:hypothetical protein